MSQPLDSSLSKEHSAVIPNYPLLAELKTMSNISSTSVPSGITPSRPHSLNSTQLFELINLPAKFSLDNVYLNGLHALRRFEIRNISPYPISVKLKSNLGNQIIFQLTNENLPDPDSENRFSPELSFHDDNTTSDSEPHTSSNRNSITYQSPGRSLTSTSIDSFNSYTGEEYSSFSPRNSVISSSSFLSPFEDNIFAGIGTSNSGHSSISTATVTGDHHKVQNIESSLPAAPFVNITTNTVEAAKIGVFGTESNTFHGYQFNQLFNYVNHIEEVTINANSSQKIVLGFLPDGNRGSRRRNLETSAGSAGRKNDHEGEVDLMSSGNGFMSAFRENEDQHQTYEFFETNGMLFFLGYRLNRIGQYQDEPLLSVLQASNPSSPTLMRSPSEQSDIFEHLPIPSSITPFSAPIGSSRNDSTTSASTPLGSHSIQQPDYQMSVKFRSRVCRSVLFTDIGETGIMFSDCVVGKTYFRDFSISNRSEIELFWILNTMDLTSDHLNIGVLKFTEYDTGEPITNGKPIPPYSPRRVRVTFKPREVGEFNYDLQLENAMDSSNTVQAWIHATVRAAPKEETLLVMNENSILDFGDCLAGEVYKQKLILKNIGDAPLEISFSSDNGTVSFQLKSEEWKNWQKAKNKQETSAILHQRQLLMQSNIEKLNNDVRYSQPNPMGENVTAEIEEMINLNVPALKEDLANNSSTSSIASLSIVNEKFEQFDSEEVESQNEAGSSHGLLETSPAIPSARAHRHHSNKSSVKESENEDVVNEYEGIDMFGTRIEEFTRIEEMILNPGTERSVEIGYQPEREPWTPDYRHGRLTRRNFKITLHYGPIGVAFQQSTKRDKKTVQCKAKSCTSFIEVAPKQLHFGDTDVNTHKSAPVFVKNMSDLPARVEFRYISKVLNITKGEIVIPALKGLVTEPGNVSVKSGEPNVVEVKLEIYPRKINPDYRKHVTVVNLQNRENDQSVEVFATNIDKNRVTFHSLFYRILTPTTSNFIDFGHVVLNSFSVRKLRIDNISQKKLLLELSSTATDEIVIYQASEARENIAASENTETPTSDSTSTTKQIPVKDRKTKLLETFEEMRPVKRSGVANNGNVTKEDLKLKTGEVSSFNDSNGLAAYLDLASTSQMSTPTADNFQTTNSGNKSPKRGHGASQNPESLHLQHTQALRQLRLHYKERKLFANAETPVSSTEPKRPSRVPSNTSGSVVTSAETHLNPKSLHITTNNVVELVDAAMAGGKLPLEITLSAIEAISGAQPPLFPKPTGEEQYVRTIINLKREFQSAISEKRIVSARRVEIPPQGQVYVYIVFTPNAFKRLEIQGKPRKSDARLTFRLLEFETSIQQPQFETLLKGNIEDIPLRELVLRSSLCRSVMELGQKNINFGTLEKAERRARSIVVRNSSDTPLLYALRKSGSIASSDLVLGEGKMGIISAYGKKEIEFVFDPSLAGPFLEKLVVENVLDREGDQTILVKATIKKPSNFAIQSHSLDLGVASVGQFSEPPATQWDLFKQWTKYLPLAINVDGKKEDFLSKYQNNIVLSNTSSKQSRTIEVRIDPNELKFKNCALEVNIELLEDEGSAEASQEAGDRKPKKPVILSPEILEEIEALEQKLKIAIRKGRKDKAKKITDKLTKLRAGIVEEKFAVFDDEDVAPSTTETPVNEVVSNVVSPVLINSQIASTEKKESESTKSSPVNSLKRQLSDFKSQREGQLIQIVPEKKKIRKTESSIIFVLEPKDVRTIAVYVRPISSNNQELCGVESCVGRVYINEYKNTDVVQKVTFKVEVIGTFHDYFQFLSRSVIADEVEEQKLTEIDVKSIPEEARFHLLEKIDNEADGEQEQAVSGSPKSVVDSLTVNEAIENQLPEPSTVISRIKEVAGLSERSRIRNVSASSIVVSPLVSSVNTSERRSFSQTDISILPLTVEASVVELGRLEISERRECYVKLINRNDIPLSFRLMDSDDPDLQVSTELQLLNARETRRVYFSLTPQKCGRQIKLVRLLDEFSDTELTISFNFYCILGSYLQFPSSSILPVTDGSEGSNSGTLGQLDLGYCYVNPTRKYAKVHPLRVSNVADHDIIISATSNLSQQCFIFSDAGLELAAQEILVPKDGTTTLYIALQPYLTSQSDKNMLLPAECRNLVGGVKFTIQIPEIGAGDSSEEKKKTLFTLTTQTLRFSAIIGHSLFSISSALIDLGVTTKTGETFTGGFWISNLSSKLPLSFHITATTSNFNSVIELETMNGLLEGTEFSKHSTSHTDTPTREKEVKQKESRKWLSFSFTPRTFGFLFDELVVTNLNNSAQVVSVQIRLFVDKNLISLSGSGLNFPTAEGVDKDHRRPNVSWNDVYVGIDDDSPSESPEKMVKEAVVFLQKKLHSDVTPLYEKTFEIENNSTDEIMELIPKCDLPLQVWWKFSGGAGFILDEGQPEEPNPPQSEVSNPSIRKKIIPAQWKSCGPRLLLHPTQKATLTISVPLPSSVKKGEVSRLRDGEKVLSVGTLLFDNPAKVLKVIDLFANYAVSNAAVDTEVLDLGKVGYENDWNDVPFEFSIRNFADIPCRYEFNIPDSMEIVSCEGVPQLQLSSSKRKIPPKSTHCVKAILKTKRLEQLGSGEQQQQLSVINTYNPNNTITISVKVQLTLFQLKFERLKTGEIFLPPLLHPPKPERSAGNPNSISTSVSSSSHCETWFSITSTANEEVRFELGLTLSPDVSELIGLIPLSRFSNSPLLGTVSLAPQETIEVLIRAHARDDCRLPVNHPHAASLLNPEGITFGTLWLSPKTKTTSQGTSKNAPGLSSRAEEIVIRGSLVESSSFELSERRIEFCATPESDQENSEEREVSVSPKNTQSQSILITNNLKNLPLEFYVVIETPPELSSENAILKLTPLSDDLSGAIEPGGRVSLTIEFLESNIAGVSEDVKIHIYDKNSLSRQFQTLYVGIVEGTTEIYTSELPEEDEMIVQNLFTDIPQSPELIRTENRDSASEEKESLAMEEEESPSEVSTTESREKSVAPTQTSTASSVGFSRIPTSWLDTAIGSATIPAPTVRKQHAQLAIRGCKKISGNKPGMEVGGGLYELDLGQQDLGAAVPSKKLIIENVCNDRVSYRIRTMSMADLTWIGLSRSEGTLDPPRFAGGTGLGSTTTHRDSHSITISFMSTYRGFYTTYITIINLDNPVDTKTVRVSMEIVARQNIRRSATGALLKSNDMTFIKNQSDLITSNHVFDVHVHSFHDSDEVSRIVMDNLFYDSEYSARSMIIFNRESVPLEFTLKSNLPHYDPTELVFSLSRTSVKQFQTLTIEPESMARVYLRVRPTSEIEQTITLNQKYGEDNELSLITQPISTVARTLEEADKPTHREIEVYVNCRLVKDYQKIIFLTALIRQPQIYLPEREFTFTGSIRRSASEEWSVQLRSPKVCEFVIGNLLEDDLEYVLMNDTMYFTVVPLEDEENSSTTYNHHVHPHLNMNPGVVGKISSRGIVRLKVMPVIDVILANAEALCKEKYVVEHLTIYSKKRPNERYWIVLKLGFGHLMHYQSASGSTRSFDVLESQIVRLLRELDRSPEVFSVMVDDDLSGQQIDEDKRNELYFRYIYIVDQLVHFGTREHAAESYLHLASLLFIVLFANPIFRQHASSSTDQQSHLWPEHLQRWIKPFVNFMAYFPTRQAMEPLKELVQFLVSS